MSVPNQLLGLPVVGCYVEDLLLAFQTSIGHHKLRLVEWFRLVEVVAVGGANLISVLVFLCPPCRAVPLLSIACIATGTGVRPASNLKLRPSLECLRIVAVTPDRIVMNLRIEEGVTHGGAVVVLWLEVPCSVEHSASAVPAASHFHREILLRDQLGVKPALETVYQL